MSAKDTPKTSLKETIASRIKMNEQLSDEERRESIISLKNGLIEEKGPSIDAGALARLVDARLRHKDEALNADAETIAREIKATLDLVEMCQWMIHIRRSKWSQRVMDQTVDFSHNILTEDERKIKDAIYSKKTLTFELGLKSMRMHGRTHSQRAENYREFLEWALREWKLPSSLPADWPWIESIEDGLKWPVVAEVFRSREENGWPAASVLWNETKVWLQWKPIKTTLNKSRGGKAPREIKPTPKAIKKVSPVKGRPRVAK